MGQLPKLNTENEDPSCKKLLKSSGQLFLDFSQGDYKGAPELPLVGKPSRSHHQLVRTAYLLLPAWTNRSLIRKWKKIPLYFFFHLINFIKKGPNYMFIWTTWGPQIVLFLRHRGTLLLGKLHYLGTDLVLKALFMAFRFSKSPFFAHVH